MPSYRIYFENGHTETVEAHDGTTAKEKARDKSGFAKDIRGAGGNPERVSRITRVEELER